MLAVALAEVPALPLHTAGKYVAGAYIVLFVLVLIYVAIMAIRLSHIERDLDDLLSVSESAAPDGPPPPPAAPASHDPDRESTPA